MTRKVVPAAAFALLSSAAAAQTQTAAAPSGTTATTHAGADVGMEFATSKAEYTTDRGADFQLDRKQFGFDLGYDVGRGKAVFARVGRIMRTEIVDAKDVNGDGYAFGFGFSNEVYRGVDLGVKPYLNFNYSSEEFKVDEDAEISVDGRTTKVGEDSKAEFSIYEFALGALVEFRSTPQLTTYMGFEVFPLSEGEFRVKNEKKQQQTGTALAGEKETASAKTDFERDDIMNLVFGARTGVDKFWVGGEAKLISETTFGVQAGFVF